MLKGMICCLCLKIRLEMREKSPNISSAVIRIFTKWTDILKYPLVLISENVPYEVVLFDI